MEFNQILLYLLIFVNLLLTAGVILLLRSKRNKDSQIEPILASFKNDLLSKQIESIVTIRDTLDKINSQVNNRLSENTQTLDRRLKLFGEIEHKLGELEIQAKKIETIGNNIQSLSELLKPPKIRGNLGEILLDNLLGQILPQKLYQMQHGFKSGQRVDAVIHLGDMLLPIDSKFPLESYQRTIENPDDKILAKEFLRTVRKHIDDISNKYILPEEDTTDIAVMYIPSEAVYYRFISDSSENAFSYALSQRVIPSSPGHLYGFLVSLTAVFKHSQISSQSRTLATVIGNLTDSLNKVDGFYDRIEGSLRSITNSFDKAKKETARMSDSLESLNEPHLNE